MGPLKSNLGMRTRLITEKISMMNRINPVGSLSDPVTTYPDVMFG